VCGRERVVVARTRQRHDDVQRLIAEGLTISAISRRLGLDRTTVRRFARTIDVDELLVIATHRESLLDGYTQHLNARMAAGVDNAAALHTEIRALGYTGSVQTVRRFVHPRRDGHQPGHPRTHHGPAGPAAPAVPKPRQISRWIMTDPAHLDPDDAASLDDIRNACPELHATAAHVRDFADMMNKRCGDRIHDWLQAIAAASLPALHSLATGLRRDLDAVIAGLSTEWNSGPAEGNVNRIKNLKRQMYGRASFGLLRRRILLAT
jgi:transposase